MSMRHASELSQLDQSSAIVAAVAEVASRPIPRSKKVINMAAVAAAVEEQRKVMYKERAKDLAEYRAIHGNGPSPHRPRWYTPCAKCGAVYFLQNHKDCSGCMEREREREKEEKAKKHKRNKQHLC